MIKCSVHTGFYGGQRQDRIVVQQYILTFLFQNNYVVLMLFNL